ncbi:MAG: HlyD family efflux transporter periplasmic adaptor subunit [Oscillatoriales cyanobacterium SM2_2_1]|nr:HlyD family efflux transporter periplasmic adaptor subunit [Oscillatoriales cyanobacterium SM2_2_1]
MEHIEQSFVQRYRRSLLLGAAVVALAGAGLLWYQRGASVEEVPAAVPSVPRISALGYLEPVTRVARLAAPTSGEGGLGSRVAELRVEEGDRVRRGEVLAILDSRERLQMALMEAEGRLEMAEAQLAQVAAGAKRGEIAAQGEVVRRIEVQAEGELSALRATRRRLAAELENARIERDRFQQLYREGAASQSILDSKQLVYDTAQAALQEAIANSERVSRTAARQRQEAIATLEQIAEVRPVDLEVAAAEVQMQRAAVARARANLAQATLRSPFDGQVLKVHARSGEQVGESGILELGQTQRMGAVLEVYETESRRVKVGQRVRIFTDSMALPLLGTVSEVGVRVQRQNVINADPTTNIDARVVEVRVVLDEDGAAAVKDRTNLQITGEVEL